MYFAYKGFLEKKPTLEKAIKKRIKHILHHGRDASKNKKWNRLSKDEKVAEFYDYVVDLIANYDPEQRKQEQLESDGKDNEKKEAEDPKGDVEGGDDSPEATKVKVDVTPGNEEIDVGDGEPVVAEDSRVVVGKSEEQRAQ